LSADPTLSPTEVQSLIENTAEDIGNDGWDPNYGHGRIEAAAALQALLPATPTLNPISNGTNAADYLVDWGGIANADQYVLEEDDNSSFSSPDTRYVGPDSAYNVTGQPGGDWYYRVRAINSVGASVWSASVSTTVDPLLLDPPPALTTPINPEKSQTYTVGWRDTGADYYTLEESHTPYFEAPTQVYSDTGTAYTATDQPLGTWYYRVRSFDVNGDSSTWSNIESTRVAPYEVFLPLVLRNAP
jgi:predicted phage tail protein